MHGSDVPLSTSVFLKFCFAVVAGGLSLIHFVFIMLEHSHHTIILLRILIWLFKGDPDKHWPCYWIFKGKLWLLDANVQLAVYHCRITTEETQVCGCSSDVHRYSKLILVCASILYELLAFCLCGQIKVVYLTAAILHGNQQFSCLEP